VAEREIQFENGSSSTQASATSRCETFRASPPPTRCLKSPLTA